MQHICLYFQVHQPYRLKRYRFFNIGEDNQYFDDFENRMHMQRIANNSYLYTNKLLLDLINKHKNKFKVSFSITGLALEQFQEYAPEVLESFKELAKTGQVEFLAETYSHSLISLYDKDEFKLQVEEHVKAIKKHFGQTPEIFRNTELIYDNLIGETIAEMGFKAMITEGAKHILGWKSPNVLYYNVLKPELKLILKNYKLSDDIAFRFSDKGWDEYPLTAKKYASWISDLDYKNEVVNLFMDYETFGEHQKAETGIFDFLKAFPEEIINNTNFKFATPSEVAKKHEPVASMNVPYAISWADEERDITAWLGNEMQKEAFHKLYALAGKMKFIKRADLQKAWRYLQTSDHFYYMSTKILADGIVHDYFNPFNSPYDAFINYMNVLSDFQIRVNEAYEQLIPEEPEAILSKIKDYEEKIHALYVKLTQPVMIERVKPVLKAIEKEKEEFVAISKTKKVAKALPKQKAKKALPKPKKKTTTKDNLTKIEGIGPKIASILQNAGINTFSKLAKTKASKISEILISVGGNGYKRYNPKTWAKQASLAEKGKWDELKKLQAKLKGGK
ncbi:MAG: polysaccharide deacetylase family protein [Chlorobi bacterium]|nr:polysaccharide deacetylase family protein [Chlorobiota bacterium]